MVILWCFVQEVAPDSNVSGWAWATTWYNPRAGWPCPLRSQEPWNLVGMSHLMLVFQPHFGGLICEFHCRVGQWDDAIGLSPGASDDIYPTHMQAEVRVCWKRINLSIHQECLLQSSVYHAEKALLALPTTSYRKRNSENLDVSPLGDHAGRDLSFIHTVMAWTSLSPEKNLETWRKALPRQGDPIT